LNHIYDGSGFGRVPGLLARFLVYRYRGVRFLFEPKNKTKREDSVLHALHGLDDYYLGLERTGSSTV
jgi:hypothetical protein